jgi:hypothetical protein
VFNIKKIIEIRPRYEKEKYMFIKKTGFFCLAVLLSIFLLSCSESFDNDTGMYVNKGKGFSVHFPSGWQKIKAQMGALVSITDPEEKAQISVVVQELPDELSLDQYFKKVSSQGNRMGARVKDSGEMTIDGEDARWSIAGIKVAGKAFTSLNYYVTNGNRVYAIICLADSENFTGFEDTFDNTLESFRFMR